LNQGKNIGITPLRKETERENSGDKKKIRGEKRESFLEQQKKRRRGSRGKKIWLDQDGEKKGMVLEQSLAT